MTDKEYWDAFHEGQQHTLELLMDVFGEEEIKMTDVWKDAQE